MIYWRDYGFLPNACCDIATGKKHKYLNLPLAFDIETTTIKQETGEPLAFMYIWQFGINGTAVYGRTWAEFSEFLTQLHNALCPDDVYLVVYVHNLGFEFSFFAPYFDVGTVFARSPHHPIYVTLDNPKVEFRCSYQLTGKSLAALSEDTKTKKLVGDLDYALKRTHQTPLTPQEMAYCENDVIILNEFIAEQIKQNGDIAKIPLTKTGYVRREVRDAFKAWDGWEEWHKKLMVGYPSYDVFCLLNKCFAGGFTHANCAYLGLTLSDIGSIDIASSYPAQMLKHKYPLGRWKRLKTIYDRKTLDHICDKYATIMHLSFKNIRATTHHHTISRHKCGNVAGGVIDNGRIVSADFLDTYITSVDYNIIKKFYDFDGVRVETLYFCQMEYLPRPLIDIIIKHYNNKCTLKGNKDKIKDYQLSKERINSLYGMTVQSPIEPDIRYNKDTGQWSTSYRSGQQMLLNKKRSDGYVLPYAVGVFVTAWARYELLTLLSTIGDDAIYCDTDSIKMRNYTKHIEQIREYNSANRVDLSAAMQYHGLPDSAFEPMGKTIGVFEYEGSYLQFKTLGAKRYFYETKPGIYDYTIAGLPKSRPGDSKNALTYMSDIANRDEIDIFDVFEFDLHIPETHTKKLGSVYNFIRWQGFVTDYLGNTTEVTETYGVALEPVDFTLQCAPEFWAFLTDSQTTPQKYHTGLCKKRDELKICALD